MLLLFLCEKCLKGRDVSRKKKSRDVTEARDDSVK